MDFYSNSKSWSKLSGGDILGTVQETALFEHHILVPVNVQGKLVKIAPKGDYTITETIATVESNGAKIDLPMLQKWPVREPRPHTRRLFATSPLITGQRVIDTFFPSRKRRKRSYSRSIRLRKNCYPAATCEMVRCQHHNLRGLRRTRQRNG